MTGAFPASIYRRQWLGRGLSAAPLADPFPNTVTGSRRILTSFLHGKQCKDLNIDKKTRQVVYRFSWYILLKITFFHHPSVHPTPFPHERPLVQLFVGLLQFLTGIHDDGAAPGYRLVER